MIRTDVAVLLIVIRVRVVVGVAILISVSVVAVLVLIAIRIVLVLVVRIVLVHVAVLSVVSIVRPHRCRIEKAENGSLCRWMVINVVLQVVAVSVAVLPHVFV